MKPVQTDVGNRAASACSACVNEPRKPPRWPALRTAYVLAIVAVVCGLVYAPSDTGSRRRHSGAPARDDAGKLDTVQRRIHTAQRRAPQPAQAGDVNPPA